MIPDERVWLRMAVATLINLTHFLMTEQQPSSLRAEIVSDIATLLDDRETAREERRDKQHARLYGTIERLIDMVGYLRSEVDRQFNYLDDKRVESDGKYTQVIMELNSLKERITDIEAQIDALKESLLERSHHIDRE